jgi:YVTN family beta-propeller protein
LAISGCGGDDNNKGQNNTANVANMAFAFSSGEVFGIDPTLGPAVLVFGKFTGDTGPFRLEAAGGNVTATGEATLVSCALHVLQVNIGNFPANQGPQAGTRLALDTCTNDNGKLHVENRGLGKTATASAQALAANPPGGIGRLVTASRSTSIALTSDDRFATLANRETNSATVIEVRNLQGQDVANKRFEVAVGQEPRYVAISPDDREFYVSNTVSGTVSIIPLLGSDAGKVVADILVGTEPRAMAVTPNGTRLYVGNHTDGTLSVIDVVARQVIATVQVDGNPGAIAITNNGDADDTDETVFVTQFYAELIPNGPGEGHDLGKQGIVRAFSVADPSNVATITLAPLANSSFTADRTNFCPQSRLVNGVLVPPVNNTFCPDLNAPAGSTTITQAPQGVYPNQLQSALIRGTRLFLPNIGAQPEPPVRFDTNVQPLVYVVDTVSRTALGNLHVNLNQQIFTERQAGNTTGINGLFANDIVALDANTAGTDILIVSRGGNYVLRATADANGALSLNAPNVTRFQTGNLPNGVVMSRDGTRAYANNEVNVSVTAIALDSSTVLTRDIPSGEPPRPDTFEHVVLVGKLAFFTALGMPDNGIFDTQIRDFVPLNDKGKASSNAWSSCSSCHPDGLADGVTWIFPPGPRQTLPLDGFFAKDNPADQRIVLWSAARGSNVDFNNNSRGVQGGCGFASDAFRGSAACNATAPANPAIYDHGITQGASDALDAQTLWVQTVRPPLLPQPTDTAARDRGRTVFQNRCATCHGGQKWTKSQVLYADNPAFTADPNGTPPGFPRDPGVSFGPGGQIIAYTVNGVSLRFLDNVGSFNASDPLEIRGPGAVPASGAQAFGVLGFNAPALLGTRYHAPYFHNGAAQTLDAVFPLHLLPATPGATIPSTTTTTIQTVLSAAERQDLLVFLNSIDGRTDSLASATDTFRDNIKQPATAQVRHANLTGDQEPPPPVGPVVVVTSARGALTLNINQARTQIDYILEVSTPLPNITQAHIHIGPIGTNGQIVLDFCSNLPQPPAGVQACPVAPFTLTGTFTLANLRPSIPAIIAQGVNNFTDVVNHILSGDAYANVHTQAFMNGEIRGQIEMP